MRGKPEVITALNEVLVSKNSTVLRLLQYETLCTMWGYSEVGSFFAHIVSVDKEVLPKLIKRILFLGGYINEVAIELPKISEVVVEMLPETKDYVLNNIATLTNLIDIAEKAKDYGTRYLIEKILIEEDENLLMVEMLMIQFSERRVK
jgi:bacterioferritin